LPRNLLHLYIYGGIDLQTLGIQGIRAIFIFDIAPDMFGIKRDFFDIQIAPRLDVMPGIDGLRRLVGGYLAVFHHPV